MPAITAVGAAPHRAIVRAAAGKTAPGIPPAKTFTRVAERLDTISDPVRLQILWWISSGERSVTDLCALVGMRQQAVTHHLNIMRLRRVVTFRREGRWNLYSLTDEGRKAMEAAQLLF